MSITLSLDNCGAIVEICEIEHTRSVCLGVITDNIKGRRLTQKSAAQLLGIDQPKISHIMNNKTAGFSLERIIKFLNTLGYDVHISINAN